MGRVASAVFGAALVALTTACSFADPDSPDDPTYPPLFLFPDGQSYLAVTRSMSLVAVGLDKRRRWTFTPSKDADSFHGQRQRLICTPFVLGDVVLIRTEVELLALGWQTGQVRYRAVAERETRFGAKGCPMPAGDGTYLVTAHDGRRLRKVRPDGSDIWAVTLPNDAAAIGPPRATPSGDVVVRAGDRIVVWDGAGHQKWTKPLADYEE